MVAPAQQELTPPARTRHSLELSPHYENLVTSEMARLGVSFSEYIRRCIDERQARRRKLLCHLASIKRLTNSLRAIPIAKAVAEEIDAQADEILRDAAGPEK